MKKRRAFQTTFVQDKITWSVDVPQQLMDITFCADPYEGGYNNYFTIEDDKVCMEIHALKVLAHKHKKLAIETSFIKKLS